MDKRIKLLILLSLTSIDLILTIYVLSHTTAHEVNPIANFIWGVFGFTIGSFVLLLFNSSLFALFAWREKATNTKALELFVVVYGVVFLNNIRVLMRW